MIDIDRDTPYASLGWYKDKKIWLSLKAALDHVYIYIWAEENNMLFNGDKFKLLNFRKSTRTFHY